MKTSQPSFLLDGDTPMGTQPPVAISSHHFLNDRARLPLRVLMDAVMAFTAFNSFSRRTFAASITFLLITLMLGESAARAFTSTNADTLFNAYNTAFYSIFSTGKAHYMVNKSGGINYFWGQAEE